MVIRAGHNALPVTDAGDGTLGTPVCERMVEIKNAEGLHMRPALKFIDIANRFGSSVQVSNDRMTADGKSIMEMSMLAATCGTRLKIRAEGADAQEVVDALQELVEVRMFDEPPPEGKT
jgi:phosphocarrier protein HPr